MNSVPSWQPTTENQIKVLQATASLPEKEFNRCFSPVRGHKIRVMVGDMQATFHEHIINMEPLKDLARRSMSLVYTPKAIKDDASPEARAPILPDASPDVPVDDAAPKAASDEVSEETHSEETPLKEDARSPSLTPSASTSALVADASLLPDASRAVEVREEAPDAPVPDAPPRELVYREPSSEVIREEAPAAAPAKSRKVIWILAAIGVAALVATIALAVIFGVPAPIAAAANQAWAYTGALLAAIRNSFAAAPPTV